MPRDHEHWPLVALLKDADGLDRVRLGDLDIRYLRHPQSVAMVPFAQRLFEETDDAIEVGETHFEQLWRVVESLSGRRE